MTTRREWLGQATAAVLAASGSARGLRAMQAGVVQTVLGPVDAGRLGYTLPHEHIAASSTGFIQAWPEFFGGREKFVALVVDKLKTAKAEGVGTIVDVTPIDVGRDVRLLEEVSRKSGVHIVAATGHWISPSLSMSARTLEELTRFFTLEIQRGIEGTGIKPGIIKVATDKDGVTPFVDKVLRAAARTSKATGVPITTHTLASERTGEKQADIFEQEGASPSHVCLGHCDDSKDLDYLTGLLKRGYTLGMDHLTWGTRQGAGILTWQERAATVKQLVDAGYAKQLFLSNDWYFGISMAPSGVMDALDKMNPDGMLFSTRKVIPYLRQLGVTDQDIRSMTVENLRRFLAVR
ncbi:MAG TPA: phosphotriesterase-related protein [Gemmatimonadales bacterium]|nr:phosphotriesterase-related protein [Gemmatimonadales bacterium]